MTRKEVFICNHCEAETETNPKWSSVQIDMTPLGGGQIERKHLDLCEGCTADFRKIARL